MIPILMKLPWKYILIALAVAALLYGAYRWAHGRGYHSRDAEVGQLTTRATEAEASVKRLRAAVDQQNAAVDALKAEGDSRATQGAEALQRAQAANQRQASTIAGLKKSSGTNYGKDAPCTVSSTLTTVEGL